MDPVNYHVGAIDYVAQQTNDVHFDGQHMTNNATVTEWHNDLSWLLNSLDAPNAKEQFFEQTPLYMKGSPGTEEQKNALFESSRMIIDLSSGLFDSSDPPPPQIDNTTPINNGSPGQAQLTPYTGDSRGSTSSHLDADHSPESMDYFDRVKRVVGDLGLMGSSVDLGVSAVDAYEAGTVASGLESGLATLGFSIGEEATVGAALVATAPEVAVAAAFAIGTVGLAEAGYGIYQAFGGTGRVGFLDDVNSGVRGFFDSL